MVLEKQVAFAQAWMGVATEVLRFQQQLFLACFTGKLPSPAQALGSAFAKGVVPIHSKAVSARSLQRGS